MRSYLSLALRSLKKEVKENLVSNNYLPCATTRGCSLRILFLVLQTAFRFSG